MVRRLSIEIKTPIQLQIFKRLIEYKKKYQATSWIELIDMLMDRIENLEDGSSNKNGQT